MDKNKPNALEEFMKGLPRDGEKLDVVPEAKAPEKEAEKEESSEIEERKNRRHRRLEEQLQKERESNIALNERLKAQSEVSKFISENKGEVDERLLRAYFGEKIPDEGGMKAARLLQEFIADQAKKAKEEALEEFKSQQAEASEEEANLSRFLDDRFEEVEDAYGVDLTSNTQSARNLRNKFIDLIQDISPKGDDGDIVEYADFVSTFGNFRDKIEEKRDNSRQKEVAGRSMQPSAPAGKPQPAGRISFNRPPRDIQQAMNQQL